MLTFYPSIREAEAGRSQGEKSLNNKTNKKSHRTGKGTNWYHTTVPRLQHHSSALVRGERAEDEPPSFFSSFFLYKTFIIFKVSFWLFETGFLRVALAVLELSLSVDHTHRDPPASTSSPSAGIKGHRHLPSF